VDTENAEEKAARRLAAEVELARHKHKLTQLDLARRTGLSLTTIQSIENGRGGKPRKRTAISLEEALDWAEGSVARVFEGGRPAEGRDNPLPWTTVEEFVEQSTVDVESAQRLLKEVNESLQHDGLRRSALVSRLSGQEAWGDGRFPNSLNRLDDALGWQPGMSAAYARGAEFIEGVRGLQLAGFDLEGDHPWGEPYSGWLTPSDEVAITGAGLSEADQELIARSVARLRMRYEEFVKTERNHLISDFVRSRKS
jgi:transcriptional regulator with XRE-family HTH domain